MEKTELEQLLEGEFQGLCYHFGERVYFEDFHRIAAMEAAQGEMTVEKKNKLVENITRILPTTRDKKIGRAVFGSLLRSRLPEYQRAIDSEAVPAFRRVGQSNNGFIMEYGVYASENPPSYRDQTDRLIKEGKIGYQCIDIFGDDEKRLANIDIHPAPDLPLQAECDQHKTETFMGKNGLTYQDVLRRMAMIMQLNLKPYSAKDVVDAVLYFIR